MRILVAEERGMCFGVRDALAAARKLERPHEVTIHGHLVHNEVVLAELEARGFQSRDEKEREALPHSPAVLITAHGVSDRERDRLESAGLRLIDTTCPLVRRAHDAAKTLRDDDRFVVVIGKPGHVEVEGLIGDLTRFAVVPNPEAAGRLEADRIGIVCQTTVPPRVVAMTRRAIAERNPHADIRFIDTTCHPTRNRQSSLEALLRSVDLVIVVGGRDSNNTRELADLCVEHGIPAHRVARAEELQREWFIGVGSVGLTAGTSTLDETIAEVHDRLSAWADEDSSEEARHSVTWCQHFRRNVHRQISIPWDRAVPLNEAQRCVLIPSLQDFQLGESSEGKHGRARAAAYAERIGDRHYPEAIRLFFAEENRHSAYLARYLHHHGADTLGRSWTDFVFRRVRRLMGLKTLLTVLLTAELIGEVYYRAIHAATRCPALRAVCAQLLRDETMHVRFHVERFAFFRAGQPEWQVAVHRLMWRGLFAAACLAVWAKHGRAFRFGGRGFGRFWREAWTGFRRAALAPVKPPRPRVAGYNVLPGLTINSTRSESHP